MFYNAAVFAKVSFVNVLSNVGSHLSKLRLMLGIVMDENILPECSFKMECSCLSELVFAPYC